MKKFLLLAGLSLGTASWAQTPAPTPTHPDEASGENQMVCRTIADTGSRLSRTRVCLTRAQWEERRRDNRSQLDRAQTSRASSGQ